MSQFFDLHSGSSVTRNPAWQSLLSQMTCFASGGVQNLNSKDSKSIHSTLAVTNFTRGIICEAENAPLENRQLMADNAFVATRKSKSNEKKNHFSSRRVRAYCQRIEFSSARFGSTAHAKAFAGPASVGH
ncbi:MAG: hypothetical protein ABIU20_10315 [Blastocatellia bacterium]